MTRGRRIRFLALILAMEAVVAVAQFGVVQAPVFVPPPQKTPAARSGEPSEVLRRWSFGAPSELKSWEEKVFKGKTLYEILQDNGVGYLKSSSENAASGLYMRFDQPMLPGLGADPRIPRFIQDAPVGVAICDADGGVIDANAAFAALVGTDARKLKDKPVYEFLRDQAAQEARDRDVGADVLAVGRRVHQQGRAFAAGHAVVAPERSVGRQGGAGGAVPALAREERVDDLRTVRHGRFALPKRHGR